MRAALSGLLLCFALGLWSARATSHSEASPVDATAGILEAFRSHRLVAISHHDDESQAFLRSLISDDRFAATVEDIVVEFGNSRYQDVMDRYQRGERVAPHELERVWQDVTGPNGSFDVPAVEQFFRAVRDKNRSLPEQRRMRVLLGEPPLDWAKVHSKADYIDQLKALGNRDGYAADLIRREVLGKGRRALIVYGALHFQRKVVWANYGSEWPESDTLVMQLESQAPRAVFTIWRVTTSMQVPSYFTAWRLPSLAQLKNTDLGVADFGRYFAWEGERRAVRDGKAVVIPREEWRSMQMQDQFDAIIYLGPEASFKDWVLPEEKCADRAYVDMRLQRMAMLDSPRAEADQLRKRCEL
ncbi:MAG TPA: hypothetical protein VJT80_04355 [Steroidobacteraceae bacterium]|nr:hypothetical protein [Steroidobacteraceae bacterium]